MSVCAGGHVPGRSSGLAVPAFPSRAVLVWGGGAAPTTPCIPHNSSAAPRPLPASGAPGTAWHHPCADPAMSTIARAPATPRALLPAGQEPTPPECHVGGCFSRSRPRGDIPKAWKCCRREGGREGRHHRPPRQGRRQEWQAGNDAEERANEKLWAERGAPARSVTLRGVSSPVAAPTGSGRPGKCFWLMCLSPHPWEAATLSRPPQRTPEAPATLPPCASRSPRAAKATLRWVLAPAEAPRSCCAAVSPPHAEAPRQPVGKPVGF